MSQPRFRISPLGKEDRSAFQSGSEPLDRYFRTQVGQDIRRRVTACYVATHSVTGAPAGYYTLSAADIPVMDVPEELVKRLPRYPAIPAVRLGRLAVDREFHGMGLGGALLFDAVQRAGRSEVGMHAMIVEAKDAAAEAFYRHHGFAAYGSAPGLLIAPLHRLLKAGK
ncbi:MAG: GNAT family N-acetyltransferase [Geminicoccaceae bacterium]|nr:GNAT family N-acetyltransferase [Geminicoccaceae bacterium]